MRIIPVSGKSKEAVSCTQWENDDTTTNDKEARNTT